MNKLLFGGAAAMLVFASGPLIAQPAPPPPGVAQGTTPVAPPARSPSQQVRVRFMSDKVITRAEVDEHVRKMFARLDANHDGFITRDEIAAMGHGMMGMHGDMHPGGAMMMSDRAALFDRLDTNHDGSISRQEFMAAQPQMHERRMIVMHRDGAAAGQPAMPGMQDKQDMPQMRMHGMGGFGARLFEIADTNKDGRVSLQEAEAAALAHFDRADLNHDGKLTPEERQQARQMMREHRPS